MKELAWGSGRATAVKDMRPAPDEQLAEQPQVQPDEFQIIAQVTKMRDAAFAFRQVPAGRGEIDGGNSRPDDAHGDLRIEIETARAAGGSKRIV